VSAVAPDGATRFERVGVLGFGTMGMGIAYVAAAAGCSVTVLDTDDSRVGAGFAALDHFLARGVSMAKTSEADASELRRRITGATEPSALAAAELVIETIVEDLEVKQAVLGCVSSLLGPEAVVATNTSTLSVTKLAEAVADPARFGGLHFFSPAPLTRLIEVIETEKTSPKTRDRLRAFVHQAGKTPVVVKDRPGFVVNRLFLPYLNQAVQAFDDGVASADDIDRSVRLGLGYPMGPLELLDFIGLDVHLRVTTAAYEQLHAAPFAPPPLLARLVEAGRTGRKAGSGFFDHPRKDTSEHT
jgi:3-hydroxybutyryl-CoA dehydrogenase